MKILGGEKWTRADAFALLGMVIAVIGILVAHWDAKPASDNNSPLSQPAEIPKVVPKPVPGTAESAKPQDNGMEIAKLDREIKDRFTEFKNELDHDPNLQRFSKSGLIGQLINANPSNNDDLGKQDLESLLANLDDLVPEGEKEQIRRVENRLQALPGRYSSDAADPAFVASFRQTLDGLFLQRWRK